MKNIFMVFTSLVSLTHKLLRRGGMKALMAENLPGIAAIEDPGGIAKILVHLDLLTKAPPRAPAQAYPLVQTA